MPLNLQRNYSIISHKKSCLFHNSLLTTYLLYNRIMAPTKKTPPAMTQAAIRKLVKDSVNAALTTERATVAAEAAAAAEAATVANDATAATVANAATAATVANAATAAEATIAAEVARAAEGARIATATLNTGGPSPTSPPVINVDSVPKGCSFISYLKCEPTKFKGTEGAVGLARWFEKAESVFLVSKCTESDKVQYATSTLLNEALSWWNSISQPMGIENAYKISWDDLKKLMIKEYCPRSEMQKLEVEFWDHAVKGNDIITYNRRFQELRILCPTMVSTNEKLLERYIWGLPSSIQGLVTSTNPKELDEAMRMSRSLTDQVVRTAETQKQNNTNNTNNSNYRNNNNNRNNNNKRPWDGNHGSNNNNNNQTQNNNHHNQQNKRQEAATAYVATPTRGTGYTGNAPLCNKCKFHHFCPCPVKCRNCQNTRHLARDCRVKAVATCSNTQPIVICFGCGESGHYKNQCPQNQGQQVEDNQGRAYMLGGEGAYQNFNNTAEQ
jgi:hypothetical protein